MELMSISVYCVTVTVWDQLGHNNLITLQPMNPPEGDIAILIFINYKKEVENMQDVSSLFH